MDVGHLDELVAVWPHQGRAAELVRELKYGRATGAVSELAIAMAAVAPPVDLVAWVPASRRRRRRRGFDQAELLARAVARRCGSRPRRLLRRVDDVAQTSRPLEGRRVGPTLAPVGRRLAGRPNVLLVDDVCTTGTTLRAAATVLHDAGAGWICGLVATRAVSPSRSAASASSVYHREPPHQPGG